MLLQTPPFPSGYARKREEERGTISIRVYKNGVQVGIIESALKRDHQYPYYEASRLYVEKGHRHVGIGRALIQVLLAECQGVEVCGVVQSIGSDPIGKKRLVQFYRRYGAQVSRSGTVTWRPHCALVDVNRENFSCSGDSHNDSAVWNERMVLIASVRSEDGMEVGSYGSISNVH